MKTRFQEFKELFEKTFQEFSEANRIKKEIRIAEEKIACLNDCVKRLSGSHPAYPIIVGNGPTRASITSIGIFPPFTYNKACIYPLNYTVKKRFRPHKSYKKSMNNKVLYVCTVENDGITITADDGYVWKGNGLWEAFKNDTGIENEFTSLEDFMALSNTVVLKLIEAIGDVSNFDGYVPVSKR